MPDFSVVQNYPDINFVDTSVDDLLAAAINSYQQTYFSLTGQQVTVQPGDDVYILLYGQALIEYSHLQKINAAARQNFLKYATGDNLTQLGANTGNVRDGAESAVTSETFTLGATQATVVTIPQGTRVTAGDSVYFATDEAATIPAGSTSVTIPVICLTPGALGNGYIPGQLNILVDTIPTALSAVTVTNVEKTDGGADGQGDLSFAEQIFASPSGYSVAGPATAYDYFARRYSSAVTDTVAIQPTPGTVNLYVLLTGGTLPNQTFLDELATYLEDYRPLTDNLSVLAPTVQNYDIDLTYYIDAANANNAATIQTAVTAAVSAFQAWTQGKIGRDIIPDQLTAGIIGAGAKRVTITSPVFTTVPDTSIATVGTVTVTYGGIDNG